MQGIVQSPSGQLLPQVPDTVPHTPYHRSAMLASAYILTLLLCLIHHSTASVSIALPYLWEREEADWDSMDPNHPLCAMRCDMHAFEVCMIPLECCVKSKLQNKLIHATLMVLGSLLHHPVDPYFLTCSCQERRSCTHASPEEDRGHPPPSQTGSLDSTGPALLRAMRVSLCLS